MNYNDLNNKQQENLINVIVKKISNKLNKNSTLEEFILLLEKYKNKYNMNNNKLERAIIRSEILKSIKKTL
jgi:hypothetical protein